MKTPTINTSILPNPSGKVELPPSPEGEETKNFPSNHMKKVTIWHNPRCTKSRQTLALLEAQSDTEIEIVKYLDKGPNLKTLKSVLKSLNLSALELIRKKETLFKELSLKGADQETLLNAMVDHPKLIERPVVILGKKAILGRPPENIHQLFEAEGEL